MQSHASRLALAEARTSVRSASLPAFAAALSLSSAIAHFGVADAHFAEWWLHGFFFIVCGAAQLLLALLLVVRPREWVVLAGVAGNLTVVALYVYSRTNGMPFGPHRGVPEEPGAYDLVTTGGEVALIFVLVAMLAPHARRWAMHLVLAAGAALWVGRMTGFIL